MSVSVLKIAGSSAILIVENVIRIAAVAVVSFWIAHQLGPGQFGILNFASAFAAIMLAIATLGLDALIIGRLTQTQQPGALLGAVLALRGISSVLVFIIAVLIALTLKHEDSLTLTVTIVISLSVILSTPSVFDYWFKARTSAPLAALARIVGTLVAAATKIACLLLGFGLTALAWTVALEASLTSAGLALAYVHATAGLGKASRLSVSYRTVIKLARESWPYMLSATAICLYMKIDVVMLGYMSTNTETGIYSLAQKLSEVLYIVPVALIESACPALAIRLLSSKKNGTNEGQMLFDLAVGGSLIAILVGIVSVDAMISLVFGSSFHPAVEIFYLHSWSCVAIAMSYARYRWMIVTELQKYAPIITWTGLGINVGMNIVLIPMYGALGAALSTVASYFVSGYFSSFFIHSLRPMGRMQTRALWPWGRLYVVIVQRK